MKNEECLPFVNVNFFDIDSYGPSGLDLFNYANNPVDRFDRLILMSATKNLKLAFKNKNVNMADYTFIAKKEEILPITYVDIAEFLYQYSYLETQVNYIFTGFSDENYTPTEECIQCLNDLNNFLNKNYGKALNNGICGTLSDLIGKIMPFVQMLKGAVGLAQDLMSGNFSGLLGPIMSLVNQLKSFVKQFVASQLKIIKNLQQLVSDLKSGALVKAAQKRLGSLVDFFSQDNIDSIGKSLEEIGKKMIAQFKNPMWPENLLLMLLRICQMISSLAGFLQTPVQSAQRFVNGMMSNYAAFSSLSNQILASDRALGTRVLTTKQREQVGRQAEDRAGSRSNSTTSAANLNAGHVAGNFAMTAEEGTWLSRFLQQANSKAISDSDIKLVGGVQSNLPKSIVGLKRLEVLVMLRRVAKKMGKPLTITSAFRYPGYNNGRGPIGGHIAGDSLDIVWPGGDAELAKFVEYCSRVGFKRITSYRGSRFCHIDLAVGNKGGRGGWTGSNQGSGPLSNQALANHYANRYTVSGLSASGQPSVEATPVTQSEIPSSSVRGPR